MRLDQDHQQAILQELQQHKGPLTLDNYTGLIDDNILNLLPTESKASSINVLSTCYNSEPRIEIMSKRLQHLDRPICDFTENFFLFVARLFLVIKQIHNITNHVYIRLLQSPTGSLALPQKLEAILLRYLTSFHKSRVESNPVSGALDANYIESPLTKDPKSKGLGSGISIFNYDPKAPSSFTQIGGFHARNLWESPTINFYERGATIVEELNARLESGPAPKPASLDHPHPADHPGESTSQLVEQIYRVMEMLEEDERVIFKNAIKNVRRFDPRT